MLHEILLNRQPSNGSIDLKICTDVANKKRQESKKAMAWGFCKIQMRDWCGIGVSSSGYVSEEVMRIDQMDNGC